MLSKRRITPSIIINATLLILVSSNSFTVSHYTNFVYKKCRNETHIPKNLVSSLLQELAEKSKTSKFYQTSTGDDTFAVSGIFQCRGNLANENCHDCILNTITKLSCTSGGSLARVQLKGCYMSLEPEPEPQLEHESSRTNDRVLFGVPKGYLQHKKCGERRSWFEGLQEARDAVFEVVTKCVMSSRIGHCETTHEGMYATGQCAGSLEECECGECVSNAFQVAKDECWGSDSGEVYLENCFINFRDNQPNKGGRGSSSQGNSIGGGSGKVAAMVIGVGVALALLTTLCYCIRSSRKKT
ncbi:Gnk2-like domain-containing protein [Tanacetum coccineum]|uniref:Gnk2-like domain-containing protein n=1 Tax=Tanacetum coccineum TaxID=301880 RepID=A0ABQ4XQD6_9ASTR